ncbi:hypothetical protein FOMG_18526 [Fusarium oxysporum f. sp. melonis 26406]|uniref:Uncharacterized protein n=1 Tax=Fusarium oxysporum f. sp. melonis 26406 TaxID=1089452 RepID=W9YYX3_FUSOX|nr:hypothetical protein FOMG_18526 [Fusarium oxysporum f. sp. melonis 26406]
MVTQEIYTLIPWDTLLALQVFLPWPQADQEEDLLACAMKFPVALTTTRCTTYSSLLGRVSVIFLTGMLWVPTVLASPMMICAVKCSTPSSDGTKRLETWLGMR